MRLPTLHTLLVLCVVCLCAPESVRAQSPKIAVRDTAKVRQPARDTVASNKSGVDTVVTYLAKDSIIYSLNTRFMNLYGKSDLKDRTIELKAERVDVNWDSATLNAAGIPDTSSKAKKKFIGNPIMVDGGETYDGTRIAYNFRTQKGRIVLGETEIEKGYYHGEAIKKVEKDVLFVEGDTTCDAPDPHYYFYSPRMQVIVHDHIVAEPVYLYIADVPVFVLPFGIFPNESGRRSGLIAPVYGSDANRGQYLSHFGYYWAINDYMDFSTAFDWFTRGGWLNRSLFRYAERYDFTGAISVNFTNLFTGESGDPGRTSERDYNIQINHNQQIDPTTRLDVNFTFSSGSFFRNTSSNIDQILQQNIVSNATISKSWDEGSRSLTVDVYRDQNLTTNDVEERLPSFSFNQGQFFPFSKSSKSQLPTADASGGASWYELIGVSYSAEGEFKRSVVHQTVDSTTVAQRDDRPGINHQVSISASPKVGYFTIAPFISYNEKWYNRSIRQDSLGTYDVYGFQAVRTVLGRCHSLDPVLRDRSAADLWDYGFPAHGDPKHHDELSARFF